MIRAGRVSLIFACSEQAKKARRSGIVRKWRQHGCAQVAKGASRAARALLRAGADPAKPVRGATPHEDALTLAAGAGRAELASALISAGAPPSGEAALLAARKGHLDVLWPVLDAARADDRLPELVAARNARGDTAVALLVARGDVDAAARLVADYRAPLADCSRDRKASLQRRTPLYLSQNLLEPRAWRRGRTRIQLRPNPYQCILRRPHATHASGSCSNSASGRDATETVEREAKLALTSRLRQ